MKQHFYSHLVAIDTILVRLEEMDLTDSQKSHLVELIETNLHHAIMDAILSELSENDKKIFLNHVIYNDHSRTWEHLNQKVENIERKIVAAAELLTNEIHEDIDAVNEK